MNPVEEVIISHEVNHEQNDAELGTPPNAELGEHHFSASQPLRETSFPSQKQAQRCCKGKTLDTLRMFLIEL